MMKRTTGIFLLVLLLCVQAFALDQITAESMMHQANEAYSNEDFAGALALYEEIEKEFASAALYLNMGNAHYRMNNIPHAILHYERARRISPNDPDIVFNLDKANAQIVDKIEGNPNQAVNEWFSNLFFGRAKGFWAWTSVALLCWAVLSFIVYMIIGNAARKRISFYTGVFTLLLFVGSLILGSIQESRQANSGAAIIMIPKADIKTSPSENSGNAFILHEGTKVKVLKENEGWLEITIAGGNIGWITKDALELI